MAIGIGFSVQHREAEFAAPGWLTPLARRRWRVGGIVLAWLMYQRRAIDADRLAARASRRSTPRRARRFWLDALFARHLPRVLLGVLARSSAGSTATSWTASSTC